MAQEMETFAARQASFDLVLHPEKRRSSSAKPAKPIAWPHKRPSPAELAHAGFFYNPYETNPDNTTCFLCRRALDGWEEDDNPITEHLKHANDCGWAIMMDIQQHSSNPAEIEDPTSTEIREARLATFGTQWPHDGKRGWVCDSEKMVDGGWYFCPTEESNDLASCAYCKLSLDGWEPQDDPFEEHYRRSSDCSFFVFAKPAGKKGKGSRAKKSRTSKASSRLSTQSTASEAPASDIEDTMDQSIMSQTSTKKKGTKKSAKSKSKASKSKKEDHVETGSQMDVDEPELVQKEPPKAKRSTRGKKRTSEDVEQEEQNTHDEAGDDLEQSERPVKKRATKARVSAQQDENRDYEMSVEPQQDESVLQEEEPPKGRGTSKKQRGRKASNTSTTAAAIQAPPDSELDAAIEADLDNQEVESKPDGKKKTSTKSKSKKKQKATPEPVDEVDDNDQEMPAKVNPEPEEVVETIEEPAPKKTKSKKGKKKGPEDIEISQTPADVPTKSDSNHVETDDTQPDRHEHRVSVEIQMHDPEPESEQETVDNTSKKSSKKKPSTEKPKKSKKAEKAAREPTPPEIDMEDEQVQDTYEPEPELNELEPEPEPEVEPEIEQDHPEPEPEPEPKQESARRRSSKVPPKTAKRYSDIPQEKLFAQSLAGSRTSDAHSIVEVASHSTKDQDNHAMSPLPSPSKSTSSLSPQSSDAENHPPSMKPARKSHATSPSKQQFARIPLAPSTPSPSKRNANMGGISTSRPWKPIDIDELIFANSSDPENIDISAALNNVKGDLSSPEKKMTVEEWIMWNAKNGEERLKRECERLVGQFESEGARAMRVLEGIECID